MSSRIEASVSRRLRAAAAAAPASNRVTPEIERLAAQTCHLEVASARMGNTL